MDPALKREIAAVNKFRAINETIAHGDSDIQVFYKDSTVFVTGGSGFLGKQLIEKLLRSCEIRRIYLLLREKKNQDVEQRLATLIEDPVFDSLRKIKPNFIDKLSVVKGDVSELKLGINDADRAMITNEVNVIIHSAATVNFNEPLKMATLINVRGTREMLMLGRACKHLRSYVHISTAFSHATRSRFNKEVFEQFYPSPLSPQTMIDMAESVDEKLLDEMTPNLIKDWPNTYTFTKAIAEEAVRTMAENLPICIVRPSIVLASYREPSPGWLDTSSVFGASGYVVGGGLGIVHVILGCEDIKVDVVPVDLANNAIITAGWATAERQRINDIRIYTVTNNQNHTYFHYLNKVMNDEASVLYPTPLAVWYSFVILVQNKLMFFILNWMFHITPAYVADAVCFVLGKPRKFVKLLEKANKRNSVLSYFTCNEWKISDKNLLELQSKMSKTDQIIYNSDVTTIDWHDFGMLWAIGVRKYILKDDLKGTHIAYRKQFWFRIAHYIFVSVYLYLLYKLFSAVYSLLSFIFLI